MWRGRSQSYMHVLVWLRAFETCEGPPGAADFWFEKEFFESILKR